MILFINIYLKLINNFWRLVLLKIAKTSIIYLFEPLKNFNYLYFSDSDTVALYSTLIMFSMVILIYFIPKISVTYSGIKDTSKSTNIDNIDKEVLHELINKQADNYLDIFFELSVILCGVSLLIFSTTGLVLNIQDLKILKFKNDCSNIAKVLL